MSTGSPGGRCCAGKVAVAPRAFAPRPPPRPCAPLAPAGAAGGCPGTEDTNAVIPSIAVAKPIQTCSFELIEPYQILSGLTRQNWIRVEKARTRFVSAAEGMPTDERFPTAPVVGLNWMAVLRALYSVWLKTL